MGDRGICIGNCPHPRAIWEIFRDQGLRPRSRKVSQNCLRIRAISGKFRNHPFCVPRKNEVGQMIFSAGSAQILDLGFDCSHFEEKFCD